MRLLAANYMFKVNNRKTRERCEIYSKLTIKTPERRQWRRFGVFFGHFEHFTSCSSVSILNFHKVNDGRVTGYREMVQNFKHCCY